MSTVSHGLTVIAGLFWLGPWAVSAQEIEAGPTLGTSAQRELEAKMLEVLASYEVRHQRDLAKQVYAAHPLAATPDGAATLEAALDSITAAMVQTAVNDDPAHPSAFWAITAAHQWLGHAVPNSGYGIENPDNVYRHISMDGTSRYEIHGRMPADPPTHLSFTLYASLPGTTEMNREGSPIRAALDEVEVDAKGRFVITVDPEPADGRANHIQSGEPTALLIARDTLSDWRRESPVSLEVRRVGGVSPEPMRTLQQMSERAAWLMERAIPFWLAYNDQMIYSRPVNAVQAPRRRGGGWGFATSGQFALAADEALVVTLDPLGARYLGFQLTDPWGVARDYVSRSGSLNASQARSNADGTITYVIAPADPGVHNWLDPDGLSRGIFAIRWQGVPPDVTSTEHAVRSVQVSELDTLGEALPPGTVFVGPEQRVGQRTERRMSYERRLRK
ncbi:MAG: hypothetical protein JRG86_14945 [Deltaproteobacteria bacterium]|nr:hypothetical protein [Deltaproteobacteria bacterium]MBW2497202.1 hypothetical protein [Deltaproteobacteria bacterium]